MTAVTKSVHEAPITVAWEITRACALRCRHCRADAIPRRSRQELDTDEGLRLVDEVARSGAAVFVVTGGDPLMRPDVYRIIEHAAGRGLLVGLSPSATAKLTTKALRRARDAGVGSVHLSLDGASADVHDGFRDAPGSFARTWMAMEEVRALGLPLQVGTSVTRTTLQDLPAVARMIEGLADTWSAFFLVPTGRGQLDDMLDAGTHEGVLRWLAMTAEHASYAVRTTACPAYRRVRLQMALPAPPAAAANDGKGFAFVSHIGEVHPSGFLPLMAGSVRREPIGTIYRDSPMFRALRDPKQLRGKCGRCEFRELCGGSRARAFAVTGDPLDEDPSCPYQPPFGEHP